MSDLENKKTEETPKKRPYNLREKKEKKAAYRSLIMFFIFRGFSIQTVKPALESK